MRLLHQIGSKPIAAALRSPHDMEKAFQSEVQNLFFMGGTIKEIIHAVNLAKQEKKGTFIHLDLIQGLSSTDKEAVEFIAEYVGADGIVTPKNYLIREAKKHNLYAILHLFIIDSLALRNGLKYVESAQPDGIEIMPGAVTKSIVQFAAAFEQIPIIASGLIQTKAEAVECLRAGATSVSTSEPELWHLSFEHI
jgi:glycerol uptake operon antiterminator